jgi:hypothetical protein
MKDPETPEQPQERRELDERQDQRAPFDSSDLNTIPRTTENDPPYRNWWVVTEANGQ